MKSFKGVITLLLAVLLAAGIALPVFAADDDWGKTVVVGYFPEEGLMNGAEEGAVKSGYAYEYLQEIAAQAGWKYEYVYGSFTELYPKLVNGEIDIMPYVNKNLQRQEQLLYPDLDMGSEHFYLASLDGGQLSDDLHELRGAKIGTLLDAFQNGLLNELLEKNGINAEIVPYSVSDEVWNALAAGEIDYSVESTTIFQSISLQAVYQFNGEYPYYLALSKHSSDLLEEMNLARSRLDETTPGLLDSLKSKYFSELPLLAYLSEESNEWLQEHGSIKIGVYTNDLPYVYENDNGTVSGVLPEYFSMMLESVGTDYPLEWKFYDSREEAKQGLLNGEIDCINPYYRSYNDAETEGLIISGTVYETTMGVLYLGDFTADTMSTVAASGARLGAGYVRDNYPSAEIIPCSSVYDCIDKLLSGEASCVILQYDTLETVAKTYDQDFNLKALNVNCQVCFSALPEDAPLISAINKMIPYVSEVELNEILNRYTAEVSNHSSQTPVQVLKDHPEVFLLFLSMVLTVLLSFTLMKASNDKKHRRQLELAMQKAEEASRAKTSFLFNMSHDIRTPMNAILGFTDIAKKSLDDPEKLSSCLDKTQEAGGLLLSLINSVLEMSRIESGKAELEEQPCNIYDSFDGVGTIMLDLAKEKDIDLSFEFGTISNNYIYTDVDRSNRIFVNLISNAIKYTPKGGRIKIRCEQTGTKNGAGIYRYTFEDNGIGMSEEFQKKLFDEFAREKNTTSSGVQGSGLGLSVVKAFVDLMNGTIECQSTQGKGTTFTLTLPLRLQTDTMVSYKTNTRESHDAGSDAPEQPAAADKLAGKRTLLVEDNEMNREIAAFVLEEGGIIVEEAEDGSLAVEMLKDKGPDYYDFILMDIQMPVMDGYEATKAIRELYPESALPIIALSANAFEEDRAASLEAGMNDHLAKPLNASELFGTLEKYL